MSNKKNSYANAFSQLQEIVEKLQNEEIGLDDLGKEVKRAAELISFCKEKLRHIETDISESLQ